MRLKLALVAALALVIAACGAADVTATTAGPAPTTTAGPAPTTTSSAPTTTIGDAALPASDVIVLGEPIALAPTHRVVNVDQDDVLNGRYGPGVEFTVNAELDPAYGTVRLKGSTSTLESGAVWASVAYSPDTQLVFEPLDVAHGWVNSAFIEPIAEWVPPGGSCDIDAEMNVAVGQGSSTANEIYDMTAVDMGDCVRIIITFAEESEGVHLGAILPLINTSEIDSSRLRVVSPVEGVVAHATDVFGDEVAALVAIRPGGGFWIDVAMPGAAGVRAHEETGQLIIDLEKGDVGSLFLHDGTIVALPPVGPSSDLGFVGYARPFESVLSLEVGEIDGDATFADNVSGSSVIVDGKALMTSGWLEAWGIYEFRVSSMPSGDYQAIVADDGAVDEGFPVVRIPFSVP